MHPRRPQLLEAGLFLIVVALPLAFFPLSEGAFEDVKLLVLAAGAVLVWASGIAVDRHLAAPVLAFSSSLALAALFGMDRAASLVGDLRPTGVTMLACAMSLLVVAPSIPAAILSRARSWLVGVAALVSLVALTSYLSPGVLNGLAEDVNFRAATFGNPVLLAGFLAASIPAALAGKSRSRWRTVMTFAALGAGLAVLGERSSYLLPPVGFLAAWWFVRPESRRVALAAGALVVAMAALIAAPNLGSTGSATDPEGVAGQFGTIAGEQDRLAVWSAQTRAVIDRPLLGWGPSNEWSAFVTTATSGEIETATRFWADAHNLLIEVGVIAGLAGLTSFVWLLVRLVPRVARSPGGRTWSAAAACTLAVYSLYEPLDVTLTPLMFMLAGAAAESEPSPVAQARARSPVSRWGRAGIIAMLVAGTAVAGIGFVSSGLEQWGRTHFGSRWALERAWAIAPWRLSAGEALAIELALDGRSGVDGAAVEARELVGRLVDAHPWNPGVRLLAADVELLLRNFPATQAWIRRHLEVFPNDSIRVPPKEPPLTIRP